MTRRSCLPLLRGSGARRAHPEARIGRGVRCARDRRVLDPDAQPGQREPVELESLAGERSGVVRSA